MTITQEHKAARKQNEERLFDMRQMMLDEELNYKIQHYRLEQMKDFIEIEELMPKFKEIQKVVMEREANKNTSEENNLEN